MSTLIQQLEGRISDWASEESAIRAVLVVGSRARHADHPADEWSDLDLMLFCTDFAPYLADRSWLRQFGTLWVCVPEEGNESELFAVYEGGCKADLAFHLLDELRGFQPNRSYRVLIDKDGLAAQLPPPPSVPRRVVPPTQESFEAAVEAFWNEAMQVAKFIRRRELWSVKAHDHLLKKHLLALLEWHACAVQGPELDTWHGGRFMRDWVDPQTWAELHHTFGQFDAADSWSALLASMALFHRLATDTAHRLNLIYPALVEERLRAWVRDLYESDRDLRA